MDDGSVEVVADAGLEVAGRDFPQLRNGAGTGLERARTARAKNTSARRIGRTWNIAFQDLPVTASVRIGRRNRRQQRARIGMLRSRIEIGTRRDFHYAAEIEHDHPVADIFDDGKVMLTIAPSVHMFVNRIALPMEVDRLSLVCNEQTGEPEAFVMSGRPQATSDPAGELHRLMLGHAEPVIAAIAANAGVAPKLLWNNVAAYLSWILKEIAHRHEPVLVEGGLALLEEAQWPGGGRNPMFGMLSS